jgi:hypothetical protein
MHFIASPQTVTHLSNKSSKLLAARTSRSDLLDFLAQQESVIECIQLLTLWQLIAGTNKCDKWDLQGHECIVLAACGL